MLFSFFKKRKVNVVELEDVVLHRSEDIYHWQSNSKKDKENKYYIQTVFKNVPVSTGLDGDLTAKIKYTAVPNLVIYLNLKVINVTGDYIAANRSIDIHINAAIDNDRCNDYKFELLPILQRGGALACI